MKRNLLPFTHREVYDDCDVEISYCAIIIDESFDHEFGTEHQYSIGMDESKALYVNNEEVESLCAQHQALVDEDLKTITLADFEPNYDI